MTVLASFVPTPEGRAAAAEAAEEARRRGCRLHVLHFVSLDDPAGAQPGPESEDVGGQRSEAEQIGQELEAQGVPTSVHVKVRSAGSSFLVDFFSVVDELEPELIVLGVRRRSPVGKALLGSRSQDILLQADCPVLAVKAPDDLRGELV